MRHYETNQYPSLEQLRTTTFSTLRQFVQNTHQEWNRIGSILYVAAYQSYFDQQVGGRAAADGLPRGSNQSPSWNLWRRRRKDHATAYNNNAYFEEFGIPDVSNNHGSSPLYHPLVEEDGLHATQPLPNVPTDEYIHLNGLRFRPTNEGWATISNLDAYFSSLYNYYYHRGFIPILTRGIVDIVTLWFTLALSILLFVYIDWHALSTCNDEQSCSSNFLQSYIRPHFFTPYAVWNFWIVLYILIFCLYSILTVVSFLHTLQNALHAKWIYEERLGISARKLMGGAVDWDRDVVQKLMHLQESGEYRIL
jgi:Autophagy protein ATG9